ncbi:hypothetical protein E2542_SST31448 [Spatholobus suberectus]|nr:hypothetical protein E2542_SST31448 [Spatholobus suberectus]
MLFIEVKEHGLEGWGLEETSWTRNMGPLPGNVDVLVHFTKVTGEPSAIGNVDPDRFEVCDAHDAVDLMAEDMGLLSSYPFVLWFMKGTIGKFVPLKNDKDILKMFEENQNCMYIYMYVSRDRSEFWLQPLSVKNPMPKHLDVFVNETVNESVDGNGKEPICEEAPITENDEVHIVDPTLCPDEVYVSDGDDDMNYI